MRSSGFSLTELMVVVTILGIIAAMAAPHYDVAVEEARMDNCVATLRSIWLGERMYQMENGAYAASLGDLTSWKLLDNPVAVDTFPYRYWIVSADGTTFQASAERAAGPWTGTVSIDEWGTISGSSVNGEGRYVTPAAQ